MKQLEQVQKVEAVEANGCKTVCYLYLGVLYKTRTDGTRSSHRINFDTELVKLNKLMDEK